MTTDPERPVAVAAASNEMEAGVIVSALQAAGIEARMVGEFTSGFRAEAPGEVTILVHSQDVERAQAVLEEARRNQGG